jgi:hypothetical protein
MPQDAPLGRWAGSGAFVLPAAFGRRARDLPVWSFPAPAIFFSAGARRSAPIRATMWRTPPWLRRIRRHMSSPMWTRNANRSWPAWPPGWTGATTQSERYAQTQCLVTGPDDLPTVHPRHWVKTAASSGRLVNFAHSGFVKDWSWDDEGKPLAFSMSCLCRSSVPKREASVMASRMDHALR